MLRTSIAAYALSSASDSTTTYIALSHGGVERNPLFAVAQNQPDAIVVVSSVLDAITLRYIWLPLRVHHPRLATIGMFAASSLRVHAALQNVGVIHRLEAPRPPFVQIFH